MEGRAAHLVRAAGELVLAALATGVVAKISSEPSGREDPLRTTLLALPLVVLALAWIHRWGVLQGARRLSSRLRATHAAGAAVLALLILGRGALDLPLDAPVLAAAGVLLLGHWTYRQVLAFRPLLGHSLPARPSALFFWLPLAVYLALAPWTTGQRQPDGDEPFYLLVTHSLAYDLDADLTNDYAEESWRAFMERPLEPQFGDPVGPGGELYSRHNELLPLALAPAYRVAGKAGALVMMAALTALLAWLALRLAAAYFPQQPGPALVAWALLALTPPLLLYSSQVWAEVPAALLAAVALDRILQLRHRKPGAWELALGIALPLVLLPILKIRFMLLALPLLLLAWLYGRGLRKRLVPLGILLGVVGLAILWFNQQRFGNPLKIHTVEELALHERHGADYLEGALGLFFDSAFGLFWAAPIWLLVVPAVIWLARRREILGRDLVITALPFLLVVTPRGEWYGGWSPPFRYGLFMLPLLALALIPLLARRRSAGARGLLAALAVLTTAATVLWLAVPGWTYNFADGRTYLLDHLARMTGSDVARFFPSSVRPRLATWLWPPLLTAAAALLWWFPRHRPRRLGAARALAVALVLGAFALVPVAAARWPTHVVEVEDAQVLHRGGHPHPSRWSIERTRWRGGWTLRPGESLSAPVVPGGEAVTLVIHGQPIRNHPGSLNLEIRAGEKLLTVWGPGGDRQWGAVQLGPYAWPRGEALNLTVRGAAAPPESTPAPLPNGLVLDRVELLWNSALPLRRGGSSP